MKTNLTMNSNGNWPAPGLSLQFFLKCFRCSEFDNTFWPIPFNSSVIPTGEFIKTEKDAHARKLFSLTRDQLSRSRGRDYLAHAGEVFSLTRESLSRSRGKVYLAHAGKFISLTRDEKKENQEF